MESVSIEMSFRNNPKKPSRHENGGLVWFYVIDIIDVLILLKIINTI